MTGRFSFSDTVAQQGTSRPLAAAFLPRLWLPGESWLNSPTSRSPRVPGSRQVSDGHRVNASTGQLVWDTAGQGFFTVNTPGTKAVVGFAEGKELRLGKVTIQLACPYASLFLTALDRNVTLAEARSALLCAVARNSNSGFKYFAIDSRTLDNGHGPILLEPVKATVTFSNRGVATVNVLDQDGRRTGRSLAVTDGQFTIDGARDKTLYYEVQFK